MCFAGIVSGTAVPFPIQLKQHIKKNCFSFATEHFPNIIFYLSEELCPAHEQIHWQNLTQPYVYIIHGTNIFIRIKPRQRRGTGS